MRMLSVLLLLRKPPLVSDRGQTRGAFLLIRSGTKKKVRLRRAKNSVFRCLGAFLASSKPSKTVAFERISKDKYSKFSRLRRAIDASDVSGRILRDKIQ